MTTLKLISGAAAFAALSTFSLAHAGSPVDYFNKIDADASGVVSQAEFVAHKTAGGKYTAAQASEKFAKLAGDDGQLTLAEYEGSMKKARAHKDCDKKKDAAT
ncbi:MAG: hypothetical protein ABNH53_01225 [Henriciella sp.]|jgi:hypothetical protein|nr:hypothetical protein [Henriciella sp.]